MKHFSLLGLLFILYSCFISPAGAQTPAFPGAEGHGRYVTGGRGGKIVHVTTLNDSGTGSFREAVKGSEKKIVVFDVGGVIALEGDVTIGANTTILGQTAPAPGITLRYYTLLYGGDNIVVRFIRSRRGQERDVNDGADATWTRRHTGIIIDHCSFSWSIDEVASFYDNNNFTMQWCTIGESLNNAGHGKGAHGYGGIWGGKLASFHHNLICHVGNRSPRFNGARYEWEGYTSNKRYDEYKWENNVQAENVDFRNCVIYNCGNGCYGGPGGGYINIVNNYYKSGPAATTSRVTQVTVGASGNSTTGDLVGMTSRYYINGNQMNQTANFNGWSNISYDDGTFTIDGKHWSRDPKHFYGDTVTYKKNAAGIDCVCIQLDGPACPAGQVTTHSAAKAFDKVLTYAGASLSPDEVDSRYFNEARTGTATYTGSVTKKKGRIDLVSDVNGYTEATFGTGSRETGFDTDRDGMPDAWEKANGLDPNSAADGQTYSLDPKKMYTNLEVYANSLVQDIMLSGNGEAADPLAEYYPPYTKEDGTKVEAIEDGGSQEDPNEGHGEEFTVTFNGSDVQSVDDYFTFGTSDNKHNFNSKFQGSYNGTTFNQGLKMESTTLVAFTTTATSTITIVQSTWSDKTLALDGAELSIASATTPEGSEGVRVYTVYDVGVGYHELKRGNGESGIFLVSVKYSGEGDDTEVYYNLFYVSPADGSTILTTQKVKKGERIGQFQGDAMSNYAIPKGYAMRGWFERPDGGRKFTVADYVNADTYLYGYCTEIETVSTHRKYTFDLTSETFYAEDHEAFCPHGNGYYWHDTTHGWAFKNGNSIDLLVGPKAIVSVTLCRYGNAGDIVITEGGQQIGTMPGQADPESDGEVVSFNYEGEGGTITLNLSSNAEMYIHAVKIVNIAETNYEQQGNWYFVKAGDANSLLDVLDVVNAANAADDAPRSFIYLPDGTYNLHQTVKTALTGNNISIIGQSMEKTIIVNRPSVAVEGLGTADLLHNTGSNLYLQDLTLRNALDYYHAGSAGRAAVLQDAGTRTIGKNIRMLSCQDTYYSSKANQQAYWESCDIHGTVDFICGGGDVRFQNSTISLEPRALDGKGSRTIAAPTTTTPFGYVFDGCTIVDLAQGKGNWNFGRTWLQQPICVFLNTTLDANAQKTLVGTRWTEKGMNNTDPKLFGEYQTKDAQGNDITPTSNTISSYGGAFQTILSEDQADQFAYDKMFTDWNPALLARQAAGIADAVYENGRVSLVVAESLWPNRLFALFKNGQLVQLSEQGGFDIAVDPAVDELTVRETNRMGGLCQPIHVRGTVNAIGFPNADRSSDAVYNLHGQRVSSPRKGLYIVGGKKVVR